MRRLLVTLLLVLVIAPIAHAQPKVGPDRGEAIKKKIRALRAYTLTEELKLDEKTAGRLFPLLAKWDEVTDRLLGERTALTRQLAAAGASSDPKVLDKLIDDMVANQKAFWELEDKRLAELRKILSPAQTAKLLIVLPRFERRIQNQLKKAMQRRSRDDDDDDTEPDEVVPPAGKPARPAPSPAAAKPCDPFSSLHGCR